MVYREDGTFPSYITDLHLRGKARKNKDQISILVFTCLVFFLGGVCSQHVGGMDERLASNFIYSQG